MKGTLLYPAYNYPPLGRGGSLMKHHIARLLAELGWRIEVLAGAEGQGTLIRQVEDASLLPEIPESIRVHRYSPINFGPIPELLYVAGLRVCPQYPWFKGWHRRISKIPPGDAVLASFPPVSNLLLGEHLADTFKVPLFLDFRDEFSGTRSREKTRRWARKAAVIEERLIRKAAHVFVTSKTVLGSLVNRYALTEEQCTVVLNGIFAPESELEAIERARKARTDSTFRMVWLGTLSQHQRPEVLIEGFRLWQENHPGERNRAELLLVCHNSLYFRTRIKRLMGDCVRRIDFAPRGKVPELVGECDAGCLSLGGDLYSYALPTKLYDYIHFQLPMLAVLPKGEARSVIEAHGFGLLADCGKPSQVAEAIEKLRKEHVRERIRERMAAARAEFLLSTQVAKMSERMEARLGLTPRIEFQ